MDIVFIEDLRVPTTIGIYEWERNVQQTISFDIELGTDIRKAAASDDIDNALNYKSVSKRVIAYTTESRFLLVDTLAERVAELILEEFQVRWLRLRVTKRGAVRGSQGVGIVIEREGRASDA
jgi:dihydroneopterin aldolase